MKVEDAIRQLDIEVKADLLTGQSFWQTKDCPDIGLSSVKMSDGPHGLRVQDKKPSRMGIGTSLPATCFPTASAAACSFNEELCYELGVRIGEEAANYGVGVVLGPGLNVKRSPLCGRNFEYFSEDAYLSGKIAAAYVKGIQSKNVTACIKHFACNGREFARMYYDSRVDEKTLRETYLTGFEIAVKEGGAGAVMTAYNKLNGEYCNQNLWLLRDVLRGEWGFNGLVVSDWGGTSDRIKALQAGADLEMPSCGFSSAEIVEAVKNGGLDERLVDASVERLYALARKSEEIYRRPCDFTEHDFFAEKVAAESAVLLKNERNALPLSKDEKIAVIGDFAKNPRCQGAGSSQVNPTSSDNILGVIEKSGLNFIGYARGFKRFGGNSETLARQALAVAEEADTVIYCLGLDENVECEGSDRSDLKINNNQIKLLERLRKLNKKIIAVLFCGGAVETQWDENADALLLAHLCGQSGSRAIVKILTGEINPSGRLAETFPLKYGDVPCASVYSKNALKTDFAEGVFVGYKYYNSFDVPVKYPFGYGLSYTKFAVPECVINREGVELTVVNTGGKEGFAVIQVYVRASDNVFRNTPYELKLFKKVFLKAGEAKKEKLLFDRYSFRFWDEKRRAWVAGGKYEVTVNWDSTRPYCYGTVTVTADNLPEGCLLAETVGEKIGYGNYFISHLTEDCVEGKKQHRIVATYDTPVNDLLYCKGIFGKIFGIVVRIFARSKDKLKANSMQWLSVRSLMQFMGLDAEQAEGFLTACNGKFFKGVKKLLKKKEEE